MSATSARPSLPAHDGWAILALPPGERDLGVHDYWDMSLERSLRRRNAPRRSALVRHGGGRASVALAAAVLGAPVVTGGVAMADTSTATVSLNLSRGSSGAQVRALQSALGITADGVFGPQTQAAVRAYQRAHGIPSTGVVGPLTTKALGLSGAGGAPRTATTAEGPAAVSLTPAAARAMQKALGVTADGQVGPQTRAALKAYEANHGLPADGQPDADSLKALGVDPQMAGSTTTVSSDGSAAAPQGAGASAAVSAAMTKIGAPYSAGSTGPSSFDCSGLVVWSFKQAGISLPRTSFAQYGVGSAVSSGNIQAGDLVFFNTAGPGASDVGIATSATTAVSATTHGVMTHSITSGYWGSHFVGARRVA